MTQPIRLTVLSDMAGESALDQARQAAAWKLATLDVKSVAGKPIDDLTDAEAAETRAAYDAHNIGVEALSTHLIKLPVEAGREAFAAHLDQLPRVLDIAAVLRPRMIRLLAPELKNRAGVADRIAHINEHHAWLFAIYADAARRIHAAGFQAVLENETGDCIFSTPADILRFFDALGPDVPLRFTWDVQNLWQTGTAPTMAVYEQLRPLIGYLHLKGGRSDGGPQLVWKSSLEHATWPVLPITRAALRDGISPAICLNPSHGREHPDHPTTGVVDRDLAFLRNSLGASVS